MKENPPSSWKKYVPFISFYQLKMQDSATQLVSLNSGIP